MKYPKKSWMKSKPWSLWPEPLRSELASLVSSWTFQKWKNKGISVHLGSLDLTDPAIVKDLLLRALDYLGSSTDFADYTDTDSMARFRSFRTSVQIIFAAVISCSGCDREAMLLRLYKSPQWIASEKLRQKFRCSQPRYREKQRERHQSEAYKKKRKERSHMINLCAMRRYYLKKWEECSDELARSKVQQKLDFYSDAIDALNSIDK